MLRELSAARTALLLLCWLGTGLPVRAATSTERGRLLFEQCAACHSLKPNDDGVGPSLSGVVGRKAGMRVGFRYSAALRQSGIFWTTAALDAFLHNPQARIPGNRMPFSGIEDRRDRADLIEYLRRAAQSVEPQRAQ